MEACAAVSATGAEHKKLEPFVGKFKATVKMWMGPGDPMVATGIMENTWDLGGRFLKQVYKGDPGEGPFGDFQGRGYWGFNTVSKKYEGVWMDTACTFMQTEQGTLSGDTWTMLGEMTDPQSGGKMQKKSLIKLKDKDHHSMEMYFKKPGGEVMKTMEIEYVRA
jgi:hypothetical protein